MAEGLRVVLEMWTVHSTEGWQGMENAFDHVYSRAQRYHLPNRHIV